LKTLVKSMCENYGAEQLCNYPFTGLEEDIDEALEQKCHNMEDIKSTQPYHKILYAWRIKRGNYRGGMSSFFSSRSFTPYHFLRTLSLPPLPLYPFTFMFSTYCRNYDKCLKIIQSTIRFQSFFFPCLST